MKKIQLFTSILCLFFSLSFSSPVTAQILGNRLILDINNISFTQRELEVYILVRKILDHQVNMQENYRMKQELWVPSLEDFKNDMLMVMESERLRQSRGSEQERQKLYAEVETATQNNFIQGYIILLGINSQDLKAAVDKYMLTLALKKNPEIYGKNNKQKISFEEWISQLEKSYFLHFFNEADIYKPITPNI
jgi:hypothetical protein